jgi:NAD(P)-dependent dehydrogenase (short-subunit alcohol dehydrogenase family)
MAERVAIMIGAGSVQGIGYAIAQALPAASYISGEVLVIDGGNIQRPAH